MKEEVKGSEKPSFKDYISRIWNGLKKLVQFFKFQLVAVVSYWSDFALYSILYTFVLNENYVVSKIISYIFGIFIGYILNKTWTFGVKRQFFSGYLVKYGIVSAIALLANIFCIFILKEYYNVDAYLSAMAATLFSFIINFSGNKLWVFANAPANQKDTAVKD